MATTRCTPARTATAGDPRYTWTRADIGAWRPEEAPDVVFSNAALHGLDDHQRLFPRLLATVANGGVLAAQMPDNFDARSHTALFDTARNDRWSTRLAPLVRAHPVAALSDYHAWLAPHAQTIDLWRTTYVQALADATTGNIRSLRGCAERH